MGSEEIIFERFEVVNTSHRGELPENISARKKPLCVILG